MDELISGARDAFTALMRVLRSASPRTSKRLEEVPTPGTRALRIAFVALGFAAVLYVGLGSLALPQGPDQAIFSWAGNVILDGGVPYRNAWDIKGPLTYYIYAFAQAVFGRHEISIRLLDLVAILCECGLLRKLVLRWNGGNMFGANCAVICYCLIYYTGGYADIAQPEGWGGFMMLAVLGLLAVTYEWKAAAVATAGSLVASAVLVKPTFLIYIILPIVYIIATRPDCRHPRWSAVPYFLLGFSVVLGVAFLLLFEAAALTDFGDILRYLYTTYETVDRPSVSEALRALPVSLLNTGIIGPLLATPIGLRQLWSRNSPPVAASITCWLLLAILSVVIQAQYWQDHWLPAALAASAFFGIALSGIDQRAASHPSGVSGRAIVLTLVILMTFTLAGWHAVSRNFSWPAHVLGFQSDANYIREVTTPFNEVSEPYNYMELRHVSDFVASHSQSDDRLVMWGWDVSAFNMSGRRSATRFGVFQPLTEEGPLKAKYQRVFLRELADNDPKYVVVDTRGAWFMSKDAGLRLLHEFPEFDHYLHIRYRLLTILDVYQIWIRSTASLNDSSALRVQGQTNN